MSLTCGYARVGIAPMARHAGSHPGMSNTYLVAQDSNQQGRGLRSVAWLGMFVASTIAFDVLLRAGVTEGEIAPNLYGRGCEHDDRAAGDANP